MRLRQYLHGTITLISVDYCVYEECNVSQDSARNAEVFGGDEALTQVGDD